MPLSSYDYRRPDYGSMASDGLEALSGSLNGIQDRNRKMKSEDEETAYKNGPVDDFRREAIERLANGEQINDIADDILARRHLAQEKSKPVFGPMTDHYASGEMQSVPAPAPTAPQQPPRMRLPVDAKNRDAGQYLQVAQALSADRNRYATLDYKYDNLGLGYDKLAAQKDKLAAGDEYKRAMTDYLNAKRLNLPEQMAQAAQRVGIAQANLGLRQRGLEQGAQRIGLQETKEYMKGAGGTIQTISQLDQLLNEAKTTPGLQIPASDYNARRKAEIAADLPIAGKSLSKYINLEADKALTPEQRTFRRQRLQSMVEFIHANYGSQLTGPEMEWINAISGEQLDFGASIAALEALSASLKSRSNLYGQAYPNAAARIKAPANPLPQIIPGAGTKQPGLRFEQLSPQERQQYGVTNQSDLDYLNEQTGREPVGGLEDFNNYGYTPTPRQ